MVAADGEVWRYSPGRDVECLDRTAESGVHAYARGQCRHMGAAQCTRRRPEPCPGATRRDLGEDFCSVALFSHQAQTLNQTGSARAPAQYGRLAPLTVV